MGKKLRARVAGRARIDLSHDRFPSRLAYAIRRSGGRSVSGLAVSKRNMLDAFHCLHILSPLEG
jgi:hypothetical protein